MNTFSGHSMIDPRLRADAARRTDDALVTGLLEGIDELEMLHQSVVEHSSTLENELEQKNKAIEAIMANMRRYLSKSLYQRISGGASAQAGSTSRRNLTIFFSDIVGFTELTDTVEPETLSAVLNTYLGCMTEICERHGGTLDKFIGDAVMVFFGDEEQSDPVQSARACVAMAVEMQAATGALQSSWAKFGTQLGLRVRMGINSGYCTLGNFGSPERMAYTVVGGNVNVASRLEHQAEPGGICISASTYALVRDMVEVRPMGALSVKGVSHPVECFGVTGYKEQADSNPWLSLEHDGFALRAMEFKASKLSALQRDRMAEALRTALKYLDV